MTLPTGTISMSQVNTELGYAATTLISLNQTDVRTLAGVASGAISMNDLRGKTAFTLAFNNANAFNLSTATSSSTALSTINFLTTGGITLTAGTTAGPTAWGSPLTTGVGSLYEVSLDIATVSTSGGLGKSFTAFGTGYSGAATTPWFALSSNRLVEAQASAVTGTVSITSTGTVRVRNISSGTTITRAYTIYAEDTA
jgi:hypothetical protein